MIQNEQKLLKTTQNDPSGDLNWPKTAQNEAKRAKTTPKSHKDPKGDLNWLKTTQKDA